MYCLNEWKPIHHHQYKTTAALDFPVEDERQKISKEKCVVTITRKIELMAVYEIRITSSH